MLDKLLYSQSPDLPGVMLLWHCRAALTTLGSPMYSACSRMASTPIVKKHAAACIANWENIFGPAEL